MNRQQALAAGRSGPALLGLAVFVVAAAARLWQIDLARFADDQATLLGSAAQAVAMHRLPLTTGMSFTIGIRHPPLATLALIPPALFGRDPALASAWMSVLDAVGAVFVFAAGWAVAGRWVGLGAGLLYALEPAAVVYGRTIWNPDLVPLCAAVVLWGLIEAWQHDNDWALAAALFAAGCAAQLHPQAAALLVVWLAVAVAKGRWRWPSLVAVLGLALTLAPYIYLQLGSGWTDVRAAVRYLQQPKQLDAQAPAMVVSLFSERTYHELLLPHGQTLAAFAMDPLGWFFAVTLAGGLVAAFAGRHKGQLVVAGCFVAPVLAMLSHSGDLAPHYALVLLPAGCVIAALALAAVEPRWLGATLLGAGLAWSAVQWVQFERAVPEAIDANYDIPLRYSAQAAAASTGVRELYVSNRDAEAGVFGYLLGRGPAKRFDGRYTLVWPQAAATYLADASLPFAYGELRSAAAVRSSVTTPGGKTVYGTFDLPAGARPNEAFERLDVDMGHAIRLLGYSATELRTEGPSSIRLEWTVENPHGAIPDDLRQFGHLVDASGRIWSTNPDFRGYPRPFWQAGDVVVSSFELGLPADMPTGGYWFDTGFYEPISGERVAQYRDGQPAGTSARIGPLKVHGQSPSAPSGAPLAVFGGEMGLLDVRRTPAGIALRWQALKKPSHDYTVFVHVLDAQGAVVAQQDGPPRDGSYPTSLWDVGEVVDDPHPLTFTAQAGQKLEIGLYTFPDLRRLPVGGAGTDRLLVPLPAA